MSCAHARAVRVRGQRLVQRPQERRCRRRGRTGSRSPSPSPGRTARRCRRGRRSRARSAPCRSAGCTSASARRARSATASGTCRRPPRSCARARCRTRNAPRSGRGRARPARGSRPGSSGSPVPSTTMRIGRCSRSYQAPTTMSKPFWWTSREVTPTTGRSGSAGRPNVRSRSALQAALPDRSSGAVALRDVRVVARVPLLVVDAVQDARPGPRRGCAGRRRCRSPSPSPWISRAYCGETV